jgi:hypothetical protein
MWSTCFSNLVTFTSLHCSKYNVIFIHIYIKYIKAFLRLYWCYNPVAVLASSLRFCNNEFSWSRVDNPTPNPNLEDQELYFV